LPMALAAMAETDEELKASQYRMLELWQNTYQRELLIMLPDTFGTTQFLEGAPDWVTDWTGQRMDSKSPYVAGDEYIDWLKKRGRDPEKKFIIASDGLDVQDILGLHAYFSGEIRGDRSPQDFNDASDFLDPEKWSPKRRIRFSSGWGTLLTNDFRNCDPTGGSGFDPISLVCKLTDANGRPAVKLSDNYAKAMGDPEQVERYRRVFGTAGQINVPALV
jgi:nicotinate phosphoribosyltransferase